MKRTLPLFFALSLAVTAYACKGSSNDENQTGGDPNAGGSSGSEPGSTPGTNPDDLLRNPIEGIKEAKAVLEVGAFTDGPAWHPGLGVLFFTTPLGEGAIYRMLPDGRVLRVREGKLDLGQVPIGNTVNSAGDLITVEMKRVVRQSVAGENGPSEPVVVATGYGGTSPAPPTTPQQDADGGTTAPPPPTSTPGAFDTLNDVTVRKDGTLYVTDPGYMAAPVANRIYRIAPDNSVQVVEAFEDVPRPNGVALSPDEKTLYVSFTAPTRGMLPFVRQYIVNDDGSLGEWTKFVDVAPEDSLPDGIAVDLGGNIYLATKAGVEVYKNDGAKIGVIPIPEKPTGMTFGGKDMKSMYVTTEGVKIWELRLNVPGISQ